MTASLKTTSALVAALLATAVATSSGWAGDAAKASDSASETPTVEQQSQGAEVREEVLEAFSAVKSYTVEQRDEAAESVEQSLEALDSEIEQREHTLREGWSDMSDAAKEKSNAAMQDLRHARNELGVWYGAMKNGADETWDDTKDGFAEAYENLVDAWTELFSENDAG